MKYILREISILRQLSEIKDNKYTTKLFGIQISESAQNNMLSLKNIFLILDYVPNDFNVLMENPKDKN